MRLYKIWVKFVRPNYWPEDQEFRKYEKLTVLERSITADEDALIDANLLAVNDPKVSQSTKNVMVSEIERIYLRRRRRLGWYENANDMLERDLDERIEKAAQATRRIVEVTP